MTLLQAFSPSKQHIHVLFPLKGVEYLWVKTLRFKVITNASRFTGSTPRRTGPEAFIVLGQYITESKKSLPGNFENPLVTAIEC
jgi:hypothetical protein